jgi:branched-subunit amino acid transport protein
MHRLKFLQAYDRRKAMIAGSAIAMAFAGLFHLWIVPERWSHSPAHGLFFIFAGSAQISWAVAFWRKPIVRLYFIGVVLAGWLITLWALTRILPAPFLGVPEKIRLVDITVKFFEVTSLAFLTYLIYRGFLADAGGGIAWRTIVLVVLTALLAAFLTYNLGRALEPYLPQLHGSLDSPGLACDIKSPGSFRAGTELYLGFQAIFM